jgi:hypothetical protein
MKRLREQASSSDPVVARAAALVAAVRPLDPLAIPRPRAPREARVRAGLHFRLALIPLALILASAVAGAATRPGPGWLRSLASWVRPARPSLPAPPALTPVARPADADATSRSPAPSQASVMAGVPSVAGSAARTAAPTSVRAAGRGVRSDADAADESALVVEAVRALRRDRDPRRAGELAEQVLQRFPHGAQVEEAMAVAMEAASVDGDTAAARHWAERYLQSFGAGRFADRARDVLAAPPR